MEAAEQILCPCDPAMQPPGDAHNAMETAVSQDLLSLRDDQLAIIDRALTDLETQLTPPAAFDEEQPRGLGRLQPASRGPAGTRAGLAALDPVRMRLQRMQRLIQYARDAEIILVDDALNRRLKGHALFKGSGQRLELLALLEEPAV